MKRLILYTENYFRSLMSEEYLKSFDDNIEVFSTGIEPSSQINPHEVNHGQGGVDI